MTTVETISFRSTPYFSNLFCDYIEGKSCVSPFYKRFPSMESLRLQTEEKQQMFSEQQRHILVKALKNQYKELNTSPNVLENIERLKHNNAFTITTGHQLCLFTGPLYFIYKIVTVINTVKLLKAENPHYDYIPVYYMASEDHDFDEANYFMLNAKKIIWDDKSQGGALGRFTTKGLEEVFKIVSLELGTSKNAEFLKALFEESYLKNENLADATRTLVNALFKEYGLIVIDGDDKDLKRSFIPILEKEIFENPCVHWVSKTNNELKTLRYDIQANPRAINLFYLSKNGRHRLVKNNDSYETLEQTNSWTPHELREELHKSPENFSPNTLIRPLYQEYILPNICYVGGGGEISYWLELKAFFEAFEVPFPILLPRNSVLCVSEKIAKKCAAMDISYGNLFLEKEAFINRRIRQISNVNVDFSHEKKQLWEMFQRLEVLALQTDRSFLGAVKAQEAKQTKGLKHLEKRLIKAQKRVLKDDIERATALKNALFPNGSLQERCANFSELYMAYGEGFIPMLLENLDPFTFGFLILI